MSHDLKRLFSLVDKIQDQTSKTHLQSKPLSGGSSSSTHSTKLCRSISNTQNQNSVKINPFHSALLAVKWEEEKPHLSVLSSRSSHKTELLLICGSAESPSCGAWRQCTLKSIIGLYFFFFFLQKIHNTFKIIMTIKR